MMDDAKLQLQALLPPAIRHRSWIDDMALRQHDLAPRDLLFRPDGSPQRLYFVAKGWLHGTTALSERLRPISTLRIRGDMIGLSWIDRPNRLEDVSAITHAELISVQAEEFRDAMRQDPELQAFAFDELVRDMMNLRMMSAVVGHMKAPDRLAYFLFIMLNRCRRTYQTRLNTLSLPMTQEEIGRILGLTNVSVNRAFRSLETDGLIQTGRQAVTFLDEDRFARRFDMHDRAELINQLVGSRLGSIQAA
ncbi:MAG: Crp/Fnr family transcriptional regulator [Pseudomonadota bacterium]